MRKLILSWFLAALFLQVADVAQAVVLFNDPAFGRVWARLDRPVDFVYKLRGYTWGSPVGGSDIVKTELYNNANRTVQYFDKARMELNANVTDPKSLYSVTTGLLVKELVSGLRQDGDNTFTQLPPSQVQIAGDPNLDGANSKAPTYASFLPVTTLRPEQNGAAEQKNAVINGQLDQVGLVTTFQPPEVRLLTGYDSVTKHNIADVFLEFGNRRGMVWVGQNYADPIWKNEDYAEDYLFFGNPTYVFGRPISEPFWVITELNGKPVPVMVQLFERRVLTYTPSNSPEYRVEMGNVGQHYYRWRYLSGHNPDRLPITLIPYNRLKVNNDKLYWLEGDSPTSYGLLSYDLTSSTRSTLVSKQPYCQPFAALPSIFVSDELVVWNACEKLFIFDLKTQLLLPTLAFPNVQPDFKIPGALDESTLYYRASEGVFSQDLRTGQVKKILAKQPKQTVTSLTVKYGILVWAQSNYYDSASNHIIPHDSSVHFLKLDGSQGATLLATAPGDIPQHFNYNYDSTLISKDWIVYNLGSNGIFAYNYQTNTKINVSDEKRAEYKSFITVGNSIGLNDNVVAYVAQAYDYNALKLYNLDTTQRLVLATYQNKFVDLHGFSARYGVVHSVRGIPGNYTPPASEGYFIVK